MLNLSPTIEIINSTKQQNKCSNELNLFSQEFKISIFVNSLSAVKKLI